MSYDPQSTKLQIVQPQDFDLSVALSHLPELPGVYRFFGHNGLLYVGKAKILKNRVSQYFQVGAQLGARKHRMMAEVTWFDTIVTQSEAEALLLECNLIKHHHPPYNVLLKDDKRFPWIALSNEAFPRLFVTRKTKTGARSGIRQCFGPYLSNTQLFQTLKVIQSHFPLRQRRTPLFKDRPCMNYSIGRCPGPCQNLVSAQDYENTLQQVILFLSGHVKPLLSLLQTQMLAASDALNFEWAATLRDRYQVIAQLSEKQRVMHTGTRHPIDVLAMARSVTHGLIIRLKIRDGFMVACVPHIIEPKALQDQTDSDLLLAFASQHYSQKAAKKRRVLLASTQVAIDCNLLNQAMAPIGFSQPKTGKGLALTHMAQENANQQLALLGQYHANALSNDPAQALMALQEALDLPQLPNRMECYDISHSQGTHTVASMVVFTAGKADKSQYRHFNIVSAEGKPDDFKSMAEVITRRLKNTQLPPPDLLIIDGGKGQLSAATSAMRAAGVDYPIISLAKKLEEVFQPHGATPTLLPPNHLGLFLLQQIRDEAHRFAITHHRKRRGKAATSSWIDQLPGIGPQKKARLLDAFKTPRALSKASVAELQQHLSCSQKQATALWQAIQVAVVK